VVSAERSDSRNHDKPLTQVEAIVTNLFSRELDERASAILLLASFASDLLLFYLRDLDEHILYFHLSRASRVSYSISITREQRARSSLTSFLASLTSDLHVFNLSRAARVSYNSSTPREQRTRSSFTIFLASLTSDLQRFQSLVSYASELQ